MKKLFFSFFTVFFCFTFSLLAFASDNHSLSDVIEGDWNLAFHEASSFPYAYLCEDGNISYNFDFTDYVFKANGDVLKEGENVENSGPISISDYVSAYFVDDEYGGNIYIFYKYDKNSNTLLDFVTPVNEDYGFQLMLSSGTVRTPSGFSGDIGSKESVNIASGAYTNYIISGDEITFSSDDSSKGYTTEKILLTDDDIFATIADDHPDKLINNTGLLFIRGSLFKSIPDLLNAQTSDTSSKNESVGTNSVDESSVSDSIDGEYLSMVNYNFQNSAIIPDTQGKFSIQLPINGVNTSIYFYLDGSISGSNAITNSKFIEQDDNSYIYALTVSGQPMIVAFTREKGSSYYNVFAAIYGGKSAGTIFNNGIATFSDGSSFDYTINSNKLIYTYTSNGTLVTTAYNLGIVNDNTFMTSLDSIIPGTEISDADKNTAYLYIKQSLVDVAFE